MLKEFKEFAIKGNAVDMAVGIIIGAAFGSIVSSFVKDLIMPPISLITGGLDFSNKFIVLRAPAGDGPFTTAEAVVKAGGLTWNYGSFITLIINFVIVAFCVFLLVRSINKLKRPKPGADDPVSKDCPYCAMTIPIKATRCPHCTSEMSGPTRAPTTASPV